MPECEKNLYINTTGDRNAIRLAVIKEFSIEKPGTGNGDLASKYIYYTCTLEDGLRVYLKRPANLHFGFDFVVCVEGINFNPSGRRRNYPTHDNIVDDLKNKLAENPTNFEKLFSILNSIFLCQPTPENSLKNSDFSTGYPCDLIVNVVRWLFIEQDIRYWNYSGRNMLWNKIKAITE